MSEEHIRLLHMRTQKTELASHQELTHKELISESYVELLREPLLPSEEPELCPDQTGVQQCANRVYLLGLFSLSS